MSQALRLPPEIVKKEMLAVPKERREKIRRLYVQDLHQPFLKSLRHIRRVQADEVEEVVLRREISMILREELNKLTLKELCALRGRLVDEIQLKQIAADLAMTPQGVMYHFRKGIQKLRRNPRLKSLCH